MTAAGRPPPSQGWDGPCAAFFGNQIRGWANRVAEVQADRMGDLGYPPQGSDDWRGGVDCWQRTYWQRTYDRMAQEHRDAAVVRMGCTPGEFRRRVLRSAVADAVKGGR